MITTRWTAWLKQVAARPRLAARYQPWFEPLEERLLLATVSWLAGSGDWDDAAHWSDGAANRLSGPGDDAVIDVAGVSVTHATGPDTFPTRYLTSPFPAVQC